MDVPNRSLTTADAVKALEDGIKETRLLRTDVEAYNRARKRDTWFMIGGALVVAVMLAASWSAANSARHVAATIADCTTPNGKCAQQGRARTADAIQQISRNVGDQAVRATIYMGQCSRLYPGESGAAYDLKLERCVKAKLAENRPLGQVPTPAPTRSPRR